MGAGARMRMRHLAVPLWHAVAAIALGMTVSVTMAYAQPAPSLPHDQPTGLAVSDEPDDAADAPEDDADKLARKTISDGLYTIGSAAHPKFSLAVAGESRKSGAKAALASREKAVWSQKWAIAWDEQQGYYRIRNLASRKCLGVSGELKSGAVVRQLSWAKTSNQLWEPVVRSGKLAFKLAGTNLALTVTGKGGSVLKVREMGNTANVSATKLFKTKKTDALKADRTYYVKGVSSGKRLRVADDSRSSGARLALSTPSSTKGEKFRLVKAGSSAYRLQNVRSGYYAGVKTKGAQAISQLKEKGKGTSWKIKLDYASAAFRLTSRATGKCLDASSGKPKLKKAADSTSQLFTFSETHAFKVYLNPGHGWNSNGNGVWDSGATGNGHEEAEFSHDLCRRVERLLANSDVKAVNGEKYQLAFWKRMPKAVSLGCDAIVSVHFDAGGGSGTLKMVGVQGRAAGSDTLASIIQKNVVDSLGLPDRGRSTRSDITCVNGAIPSMLVEVCFMDNAHDVHTYLGKRKAVAKALAAGIKKASRTRAVIR